MYLLSQNNSCMPNLHADTSLHPHTYSQALLVSYLGDLGTAVSAPALILCTRSAALYDELCPPEERPAAEASASMLPGINGAEMCYLKLQQRYQVRWVAFCSFDV